MTPKQLAKFHRLELAAKHLPSQIYYAASKDTDISELMEYLADCIKKRIDPNDHDQKHGSK